MKITGRYFQIFEVMIASKFLLLDLIDPWESKDTLKANIEVAVATAESVSVLAVLSRCYLRQTLAAVFLHVPSVSGISDVARPVPKQPEFLHMQWAPVDRWKLGPACLQERLGALLEGAHSADQVSARAWWLRANIEHVVAVQVYSLARCTLHFDGLLVLVVTLSLLLLAAGQLTKVLSRVHLHGLAKRTLDVNPVVIDPHLLLK